MENLNKENFWNEMFAKYPLATQEFCNWIDKYKLANNWLNLFAPNVKFHDVPIEMQTGILIEFMTSNGGCHWEADLIEFEIKDETRFYLEHREQELNLAQE